MERKTIKDRNYRNEYDAYFEKDFSSMEGWYHFCDGARRECVPHIWKHDCHTWLYLPTKDGYVKQYINYCPSCGKKMD